jgi:hypothetical protein
MIDLEHPKERNLYVIRKGQHSVNWPGIAQVPNGFIYGHFKFLTVPIVEHDQINKLVGLSDKYNVHWSSIRIGWKYIGNGQFEIYAYQYAFGKRSWQKMCVIYQHEQVSYSVSKYGEIEVKHYSYRPGKTIGLFNTPWLRLPYYGGKEPAPNDIKIELTVGYN